MPGVNASGEIFSLNGDVRFEGPVSFRAGAGGSLSVSLEADACHGLSLEASARALAEANAFLSVLLPAVRGDVFAAASAGLSAKAQLKPDLFERFGLIADVAAYAEASAGFRLAAGLDFSALASWGRDNLDGVALEIFLAFLREVVLEAGVWGRVGVAAMAQAHAEVTLNLGSGDDAGFVVEAGAAVGWGGGTGWDFYAAAGLTDPRRFYRTAVTLITREMVDHTRRLLPPAMNVGSELVALLLPMALNSAYEIGQKAALGTLGPPEELVEPFLRTAGDSLREYLLDKVLEASQSLLFDLIDEAHESIAGGNLPPEREPAFRSAVDDLVDYVRSRGDDEIRLEDLPPLAQRLLDVATAVAPELVAPWRVAIALGWTAMAAAQVLGEAVPVLSGSGSVVGLGGGGLASGLPDLPSPPSVVRQAYAEALGREVDTVGIGDAVDFLVATAAAPLLAEQVPAAAAVLNDLAALFDLSLGDVLESALRFGLGENVATLVLYQRLRDFAQARLDTAVRQEVLPALRQALGANGREYVETVVEPSLAALSTFLFAKLDAVVGGLGTDEESAFLGKLSAGCSAVVTGIFARNVLFVDRVLTEHLLSAVPEGLRAAARAIRSDPFHVATRTIRTLLPSSNPALLLLGPEHQELLQEFLARLAEIGADAVGPAVWTSARRQRLADLKRAAVLGQQGEAAFRSRGAAEDFVAALVLCDYVPNEQALFDLASLLGVVMAEQAAIVVPGAAGALADLCLGLGAPLLADMQRRGGEFLDGLQAAIDSALKELDKWRRRLAKAIADAKRAARDLEAALDSLAAILRNPTRRRQIKDALYALGARRVEAGVRALDGDPEVVSLGEDVAVSVAVGAYWVAFTAATPLIDFAIGEAADALDFVGNVIDGALDAADALDRMVQEAMNEALGAVSRGMGLLELALPKELTPSDVARAIADALRAAGILGELADALDALGRESDAAAAKVAATGQVSRAKAAHRRSVFALREARATGPLRVDVTAPVAMASRLADLWAYGRSVPLRLRVQGITASFLRRGKSKRVRIAVNGRELHYEAVQWRRHPQGGFELRRELDVASGLLVAGTNVLEVSVADGRKKTTRRVVPFLVNPHTVELDGRITIDVTHTRPPTTAVPDRGSGRIVLRWEGRDSLSLDRWRVVGAEGRTHRFGETRIEPGGSVTLLPDSPPLPRPEPQARAHGARGAGDPTLGVFHVIDPRGIVRAIQETEIGPPSEQAAR